MKYSFIMPTYNRGSLLEESLLSLVNQDFKKSEFEIVIIDDNSKDNTKEIIKKIQNKNFVSINYHKNNENKGIGYNRNLGIKLAKGDIIIQTEDDAKYPKSYLTKIDESIKETDDKKWGTFIVYPRKAWNFNEGEIPKLIEFRRMAITKITKEGKRIIMGGWIFKRDLAIKIGGYKTLKIGEDTEFVQRMKNNGYKCYAIYSTYRIHHEPDTFKNFYKRMYKQGYAYKEYKESFNSKVTLFGKLFWIFLIILPIFCVLLSIFFGIYGIIIMLFVYFMLTILYQETRYMYPIIRKSKYKYLIFFVVPYYLCEVYGILNGRIRKSIEEKTLIIY